MLSPLDLRKVNVFRDLPVSQLELIYELVSFRDYSAGEFIFTQGQPGDAVFFVTRGRVKISVTATDGREKIMHVMSVGQVFGEVVLFDAGSYPASAQAMEAAQVGVLKNQDLFDLLRQHTELAINLLRLLARRLRMAQRQVQDLALKDAYERVVQLIVDLAETKGCKEANGSIHLDLDLTREEMAKLTGITRETFTRMLAELRQAGLLAVRRNQVLIPSLARLREIID